MRSCHGQLLLNFGKSSNASILNLYVFIQVEYIEQAHSVSIFKIPNVVESSSKWSGRSHFQTLNFEPGGSDTPATLMAGYMAFRAERCDMQASTLSVCLPHICIHTLLHIPQGLPLITADLCTFRLWNVVKQTRGQHITPPFIFYLSISSVKIISQPFLPWILFNYKYFTFFLHQNPVQSQINKT